MASPLSADRLLTALRAEGVRVAEHPGWRTHNRNHKGRWGGVNGIVIHHTAGRDSLNLCYRGTSALPGPLCHTHLAKSGTATMMSAGRANHAGSFPQNVFNAVVAESKVHPRPSGPETVDGNTHFYGLEVENLGNGKDPYPAVQYEAAVRWAAALCRAHGWSENSVIGHKEGTTRKIDPSFSMDQFRADVAERLKHPASWNPGSTPPTPPKKKPQEGLDMTPEQIHAAVWKRDAIPSPSTVSTHKSNPTWKAESYLPELVDRISRLTDKVDSLAKQVAELKKGA